jgi:hypothetical protein
MGRLGAVAGLARDVGVASGGADFGLIVMAHHAGVLSGIGDRARADHIESGGPVVAVLAEAFGDDGGADDEEEAESGEEDQGRADEVPGVTHDTFQTATPFVTGFWTFGWGSGTIMTKRPVMLKLLKAEEFSTFVDLFNGRDCGK